MLPVSEVGDQQMRRAYSLPFAILELGISLPRPARLTSARSRRVTDAAFLSNQLPELLVQIDDLLHSRNAWIIPR